MSIRDQSRPKVIRWVDPSKRSVEIPNPDSRRTAERPRLAPDTQQTPDQPKPKVDSRRSVQNPTNPAPLKTGPLELRKAAANPKPITITDAGTSDKSLPKNSNKSIPKNPRDLPIEIFLPSQKKPTQFSLESSEQVKQPKESKIAPKGLDCEPMKGTPKNLRLDTLEYSKLSPITAYETNQTRTEDKKLENFMQANRNSMMVDSKRDMYQPYNPTQILNKSQGQVTSELQVKNLDRESSLGSDAINLDDFSSERFVKKQKTQEILEVNMNKDSTAAIKSKPWGTPYDNSQPTSNSKPQPASDAKPIPDAVHKTPGPSNRQQPELSTKEKPELSNRGDRTKTPTKTIPKPLERPRTDSFATPDRTRSPTQATRSKSRSKSPPKSSPKNFWKRVQRLQKVLPRSRRPSKERCCRSPSPTNADLYDDQRPPWKKTLRDYDDDDPMGYAPFIVTSPSKYDLGRGGVDRGRGGGIGCGSGERGGDRDKDGRLLPNDGFMF